MLKFKAFLLNPSKAGRAPSKHPLHKTQGPVEPLSFRESLLTWSRGQPDATPSALYEPIISALVSLKNIEIEQMNSELKKLNQSQGNRNQKESVPSSG